MWVLLAWLAAARAEWVEISQHHYRRPVHLPHQEHVQHYPNHSLAHDWTTHLPDPFKTNQDFNYADVKTPEKRPTDFITGKIERVPNVGSVKRVQITNTPVKSPAMNDWKRPDNNDRKDAGDEINLKPDIFKDSFKEIVSLSPVKDKMRPYDTRTTNRVKDFLENVLPPSEVPNKDARRPTNTIQKVHNEDITKVTIDHRNNPKVSVVNEVLNKNEPQFITKNDKIHLEANIQPPQKVDSNRNVVSIAGGSRPNIEIIQKPPPKSDTQNTNHETKGNEFKVKTMENIVKFMRVVTETISSNARRGVDGKVQYLNQLKDVMLANIKERIDATWPDDGASLRRLSRSASARGHVEFPSSESALMTISFLTFAVFLIKLVLQVIQTYKNKAMIMAPVMVATAGRHYARKQRKN